MRRPATRADKASAALSTYERRGLKEAEAPLYMCPQNAIYIYICVLILLSTNLKAGVADQDVQPLLHLLRQYLYFCTSKASKLSEANKLRVPRAPFARLLCRARSI